MKIPIFNWEFLTKKDAEEIRFFSGIAKSFGFGGSTVGATPSRVPGNYLDSSFDHNRLWLSKLPLYDLYRISEQSSTLKTVKTALRKEIFRTGADFEPRFVLKCSKCESEFKNHLEECETCSSTELFSPDLQQLKRAREFVRKVNDNKQNLLDLSMQCENDLEVIDDMYIFARRSYEFDPNGEIVSSEILELIRVDPVNIEFVQDAAFRFGYDESATPVNVCPVHRDVKVRGNRCPTCDLKTYPAYFVSHPYGVGSGRASGASKYTKQYFIEGEIIHESKYSPGLAHGVSPIYSLWSKLLALEGMDSLIKDWYVGQRYPKGLLFINGQGSPESNRKSWDEMLARLRKNPHDIFPMSLDIPRDSKTGKLAEFVKLFDSLADMQYTEAKESMRREIGAIYGVMPIMMGDLSTSGGLNNEGLQVTVSNRAVEDGQHVWNKTYEAVMLSIGITDWLYVLNSNEEKDEAADVQLEILKAQNAQLMLQMGFEVELNEDGEFEFSGEAELPTQGLGGFGQQPDNVFDQSFAGEPESKKKSRVHLGAGEKPPSGATVQVGPRGGRYYESGDVSEDDKPKETDSVTERFSKNFQSFKDRVNFDTIKDKEQVTFVSGDRKLAENFGDKGRVDIEFRSDEDFPKNSIDVIHTHTVDFPPSGEDIWLVVSSDEVSGLTLFTPEGNAYVVTKKDNFSKDKIGKKQDFDLSFSADALKALSDLDIPLFSVNNLDESSARKFHFKALENFGKRFGLDVKFVDSKGKGSVVKVKRGRQSKEEEFFDPELNKLLEEIVVKRNIGEKRLKEKVKKLSEKFSELLKRKAGRNLKKLYKSEIEKVEKELKIDIGFGGVDQNTIDVIKNQRVFNTAFSRVDKSLNKKLNSTISSNFKKPDFNLDNLVKDMKEVVDLEDSSLERIARTESANVRSLARENSYNKIDKDRELKFKWLGPDDSRTSVYSKRMKRDVEFEGNGKGVSLKRLKQLVEKNADPKIYSKSRPFVTHINMRHTFARVV